MRAILISLIATSLVASTASSAQLTGAVIVACNSTGNDPGFGGGIWSTSTEHWWKLWINEGTPGGAFVNGPTATEAGISMQMTNGSHSFTIQSAGDYLQGVDYFALNLFFDGELVSPGISAFTRLQTSSTVPQFQVNQAAQSSGTELDFVTPAGTLTFVNANTTVTLTGFSWAKPVVYGQDRIGPSATSPDGQSEFVGRMTLNVAVVPEPATNLLLAVGLVGVLFVYRRKLRFTPS